MNDEWWISWYSPHPMSTFEMHSPWWISGWACGPEGIFNVPIVVAAVRAADEDAAKAVIVAAYDVPPTDVRWRFCEDLEGRSPFSDRFPKAWWMAWDSERTCACPAHARPDPVVSLRRKFYFYPDSTAATKPPNRRPTVADDARPDPVVSLRLETNVGGFAVTICACGVLLATSLAWEHIDRCEAATLALRAGNPEQGDDR